MRKYIIAGAFFIGALAIFFYFKGSHGGELFGAVPFPEPPTPPLPPRP